MSKLSIGQKNWLLSAHVVFAALWTGAVLSMFLLSLRNTTSTNADVLNALNSAINLLDDWIVIPSAIGSVVTATLLCWVTNYGFTKFYWVITKWFLTTGLIVFGTFWLFPWGNTAEKLSAHEGLQALSNPIYEFDAKGVLFGAIIQTLFLFIIIGISVLKPWGRRPSTVKN
ncbi:conserved hypothetical protein [Rippkaea orientalis PCC 8801]|uniref:Integral membrane protein n=1 Tax=Rippkaea orientalis (strain PCC 8801 / RF-1) TaxID=41431 RepID=B7K460_RIPO1|nr:hypothetical protein [Rippkaea orientalis]ACK67766.1 conserved hypothetical protein [Rippkaea orientalis PCC 8801]